MRNKRVLISGASIAGPALAYWLHRYGFEVTIVEQADVLRMGGYKIDIRGKAIDVVKSMGIYDEAGKFNVAQVGVSVLDEKGIVIDELTPDAMGAHKGDDLELLKGDLSRVLYNATVDHCEYIFSNSIKSVKQYQDELDVEFVSGPSRQFDLLIGADGIHSNVRSLIFGDESLFSHNLGDYYVAICSIETELHLERHEFLYSQIDKLVNVYCPHVSQAAKAMFVFRSPSLRYSYKDIGQQKEIVAKLYADAQWQVPHMLKDMSKAPDFYFDEVKQIRMDRWSKGRTIVIGDAAFSPCLASGQGTSVALVGAYVLAGELARAGGNYARAFADYEIQMRSFVDLNQKLGETIIEFMVPKLKVEAWIGPSILNMIQVAANGIELKEVFNDKIQTPH